MTDEQIIERWKASGRSDLCTNDHDRAVEFARAIESAVLEECAKVASRSVSREHAELSIRALREAKP